VRVTRNFERNLDPIEGFLRDAGAPTFAALLTSLLDSAVPLLAAQPGAGRPFLERTFAPRAFLLLQRLTGRLGAREVREYLVGGFVILYLVAPRTVYLLAIRDQRQVAYALER
jgi:plasmid stabilization system protein ParE